MNTDLCKITRELDRNQLGMITKMCVNSHRPVCAWNDKEYENVIQFDHPTEPDYYQTKWNQLNEKEQWELINYLRQNEGTWHREKQNLEKYYAELFKTCQNTEHKLEETEQALEANKEQLTKLDKKFKFTKIIAGVLILGAAAAGATVTYFVANN